MPRQKLFAILTLLSLAIPQVAAATSFDDTFPIPGEEEVCVDPVDILPIEEQIFAELMGSELTMAYAQSIEELGFTLDFLSAVEQTYRFFQADVPADARHVIVPALDGGGHLAGFYVYTTSASRGVAGADFVRLFTPDIDPDQQTVRNYIDPRLCAWVDVVVDDAGNLTTHQVDNCNSDVKPADAWALEKASAKELTYGECVGLGLAAVIGGAEILGVGSACRAICGTCAIPPHASCLGCAACAIGYIGCAVGIWWSC